MKTSDRARAARARDERLAQYASAWRTRKTARAQGWAARAREKRLTHETSASRTRKTARAEPERFGGGTRSSSRLPGCRTLGPVSRQTSRRIREGSPARPAPARGFFDNRSKFKPGQALKRPGSVLSTRGRAWPRPVPPSIPADVIRRRQSNQLSLPSTLSGREASRLRLRGVASTTIREDRPSQRYIMRRRRVPGIERFWEAYSAFVAAFREAAEKFKAGDRTVRFPRRSFPRSLPFVSAYPSLSPTAREHPPSMNPGARRALPSSLRHYRY
jgi:hypothetical protein